MSGASTQAHFLVANVTSQSADSFNVTVQPRGVTDNRVSKQVEAAIYAHIRAIRSLGKTTANTAEIANALNLSVRVVEVAVRQMSGRGVKIR